MKHILFIECLLLGYWFTASSHDCMKTGDADSIKRGSPTRTRRNPVMTRNCIRKKVQSVFLCTVTGKHCPIWKCIEYCLMLNYSNWQAPIPFLTSMMIESLPPSPTVCTDLESVSWKDNAIVYKHCAIVKWILLYRLHLQLLSYSPVRTFSIQRAIDRDSVSDR